MPNTTKADIANTVDQDETAHNEPSHLDLQCLPSSPVIFISLQFEMNDIFLKFCRRKFLSSAFLALF